MAGERPMLDFFSVTGGIFDISIELTPPSLRATSPIFCAAKHPVRLRDTAGRRENTHKASERLKAVQEDTYNTLPLLIVDEIGGVPAGRKG